MNAPVNMVYIVGIGDDGPESLTTAAKARLEEADLLLGPERALASVPSSRAERVAIATDLEELVRQIEAGRASRRIVVLASGDPLFYGVARFLRDRFGKDAFEVIPHVSTMQLAFARVMESWDEAYLTDAALHPLDEIIHRIRIAEKVGLFTSEDCTPADVARALLDESIDYFRAYVCENLGTRNEVVTQGTLAEIAEIDFSPLNVMILIRQPDVPDRQRLEGQRKVFGNADEMFRQSRPKQGLLTPTEVRTLALAQLNVHPESVVWDIGAGSGSVSVEAAQLARSGRVYAIEPDPEDCQLIRSNMAVFGVTNVEVVLGRAPDAFAGLPSPDSVFIGGTGRETVGILSKAFDRLKPGGNLVCNVASLENVHAATATLKKFVGHVGLLLVNVARGAYQLENIRFEALNPSFLVYATKPAGAPRKTT
jgi:precorrin-6Y C5,15-methyltransferase (decarboxylating)